MLGFLAYNWHILLLPLFTAQQLSFLNGISMTSVRSLRELLCILCVELATLCNVFLEQPLISESSQLRHQDKCACLTV